MTFRNEPSDETVSHAAPTPRDAGPQPQSRLNDLITSTESASLGVPRDAAPRPRAVRGERDK